MASKRCEPKARTRCHCSEVVCVCRVEGWPEAETPEPPIEEMERWTYDGIAEATDGCRVEPDGVCSHGHPSWMLRLGYV